MAIIPKRPRGIAISHQGTADIHSLTPESSVLWGEAKRSPAKPAWITPPIFRRSNKGAYALFPLSSLQAVSFPGETALITTDEMLSRAYKERYQQTKSEAAKMGKAEGGVIFLTMAILMAVALVLTMSALSLPQAIANMFGG